MLPHDPGFVSGFIGVSIGVALRQIFHHVRIALRCKKELNSLRDLVMRIEPIIDQIQQYRLALNRKRGIPISQRDINMKASAVNDWLKRLNSLLQKASTMAQECTIPSYNLISRNRISRRISRLNTKITHHLESDTQMVSWLSVLEGLGNIKESIEALAPSSSATTSATTSEPVTATGIIINEPIIVGQESAVERLEELVTDADILNCTKLKRFPKEFGERGAFPLLEQFSMVKLKELEESPIIEEGGMPSLKIVTIMLCETIKMFPECYLNIKQLRKFRVYGCSEILENLGRLEKKITEIKIITLSTIETKNFEDQFLEVRDTLSSWLYSEFSSSEISLFLRDLYLPL